MSKNIPVEVTLDETIRNTLASPPTASAPLLQLIVRVTSEIEAMDAAGRAARARAIDPTVPDGVAERSKAEDNEFRASRYRAGLAEIHRLHDTAVAAEASVSWNADADRVQTERDRLVAEFRMRYPAIVEELVALFTAIRTCDRAVDCLHAAAPASDGARRLRKVECEARNITTAHGESSIIESTRLPKFSQHGCAPAWPIWQQPLAVALVQGMFPRNGMPDPSEAEFYEPFFDSAAGHFVMRRRDDAPPLITPPAPSVMDMHEQILAEQQSRREEIARDVEGGVEQERRRLQA